MKERPAALIAAGAAVILAATAAMWVYFGSSMSRITESIGSLKEYGRHYLFVCDDDSEMWQEAYQQVEEAARASDAVLEWAGQNSPVSRSLAECMDIGIASRVDGIILVPDGTEEIRGRIQYASECGIPVVNLMRDVEDSGRISFVGTSYSRLGELYGEQILALLQKGENRICLLADAVNSEASSNLLYSQIMQTVNRNLPSGVKADIYTENIDSRDDFEAEEIIRNILLTEERPDILICVNSVQTECARTALVDYNMVNDVRVIGFYASGAVLTPLRNELLSAAIICDVGQAGEQALEALNEYLNSGHVSDYFDIALEMVTSENVNHYIYLQNKDKQPDRRH